MTATADRSGIRGQKNSFQHLKNSVITSTASYRMTLNTQDVSTVQVGEHYKPLTYNAHRLRESNYNNKKLEGTLIVYGIRYKTHTSLNY
jgi:hypothetical protein